uniref:DH domain-containing protein n=1 Tax=Strongyloides papillosus TaxID=174720 RepID=A0A0N5BNN0_STREA
MPVVGSYVSHVDTHSSSSTITSQNSDLVRVNEESHTHRVESFNRHHNIELLKMERWKNFYYWNPLDNKWRSHEDCRNLPPEDIEKQSAIREFIGTEKNHCEVLILLLQCYHINLKEQKIFINDGDVNLVTQITMNTLIDFHLDFLLSLKQRMEEGVCIGEISDIVLDRFSDQKNMLKVLVSYTELCSSLEEMKRLYDVTIKKNAKFSAYCARLNADPHFKGRDYKSCLDLLAQRCTKYPLLLERIIKLEKNSELLGRASASAIAMRKFTSTIDENLKKCELNRDWESIRQKIDRNDFGIFDGDPFTLQDLIYQDPNDPRKVICISQAYFKPRGSHSPVKLLVILFDDIIVLFVMKHNNMYFFNFDNHQAVYCIKKTSLRPIERRDAFALIYNCQVHMDMLTIEFDSKSSMISLGKIFSEAKEKLEDIEKVESGNCGVLTYRRCSSANKGTCYANFEDTFGLDTETFKKYNLWWSRMETLFDDKKADDLMMLKYIQDRTVWYKDLKNHIAQMPFARNKQVSQKTVDAIINKFNDLNRIKIYDNAGYLECIRQLEMEDCKSLFDCWNNIFFNDNEANDIFKAKSVKRVSTYNGEEDKSFSKEILPYNRRHTVVFNAPEYDVKAVESQCDFSTFAAVRGDASRRATEKLLNENASMRAEIIRLRSDLASMTAQVESMKALKNLDIFLTSTKSEESTNKETKLTERKSISNDRLFTLGREFFGRNEELVQKKQGKLDGREKESKKSHYIRIDKDLSNLSACVNSSGKELPDTPDSSDFYNLPGAGCYATKISQTVDSTKEDGTIFQWPKPMPKEDSPKMDSLFSKQVSRSKSFFSFHNDNKSFLNTSNRSYQKNKENIFKINNKKK